MGAPLDREKLFQAFEMLGRDLADQGKFVELAVYGGSAIMLQFEWRRSTQDVDAIVREGFDEQDLARAATRVAGKLDLEPDWLNDAVGMFTPLREDETLFQLSGCYPAAVPPGLRVFVARPHYLLAMKLQALSNVDRGERDMVDARAIAHHLGITDEDELCRLYAAIHDEPPSAHARMRFPAVLGP